MKFIAVTHTWFVNPKGCYVTEFEVKSKSEALDKGILINHEHEDDFCHSSTKVIQIGDMEEVYAPRKLTWKERFLGVIEADAKKTK